MSGWKLVGTKRPVRVILSVLLVTASLSGCAKSDHQAVYPVRGRVFYRGKPTANAMVTFHPVSDNRPETVRPVGRVDNQGYFTLTSYAKDDGAPEGEYQVTVVWFLASRPVGDETVSKNYLPEKYGRVESSHLRVSVPKGGTELQPFELK
jgi:hypothetical protein